ncbi:protein MRG1-like isoform X2 [Salvia hispanica]|uniref:protein MRG1-like isoform X2 n=1 Tax=Salvia hispanica TaxID=49212 RepID=UPI0020095435|nr:protein MRG1-like isoform X2 [Salvia hispanica]
MSSSGAIESSTPISGGCDDGGGTTSSVTDSPMRDEAVDSSPFQEGERVLAFHGPCLYDAKVQRVESCSGGWRYYVHYPGWKKTWDEWKGVEDMLKHTEANIQKKEDLKAKHSLEKNTKLGRPSLDKIKSSTGVRGRKRKHETVKKEESFVPSEKHVNLQIPSILKKQLVDDHESITHLGQLVKLPRNPSACEILNKYLDYQVKKDGKIVETVKEIVDGLRCYFDKALPAMLLYKEERQQYKEVIADNVSPSGVYGAEHLLRLFVKLPEMLSCVHIEMETLSELQQRLLEFLRFLQSNQREFFDSNYEKVDGIDNAVKDKEN